MTAKIRAALLTALVVIGFAVLTPVVASADCCGESCCSGGGCCD